MWPSRFAALALLLVACGGDDGPARPASCGPEDGVLCGRPRNLAHRGGASLRPENTLAAFTHAAMIGADVLELDVQLSADGEVVVMHDATVDRTTDGQGAIAALTAAQLAQLDAGYRFTTDGGATFPYRGTGIGVPTLAAVLAAFPAAHFSIEIKDSALTVEPVLAQLAAAGLEDHVVIASFLDSALGKVRTLAPTMLTTLSLGEMVEFANLTPDDEATYVAPGAIAQVPVDQLTPDTLARAHRHGLVVQAWTVDDEATMQALLALGVDGIITDAPDRLQAVIGMPPTPR